MCLIVNALWLPAPVMIYIGIYIKMLFVLLHINSASCDCPIQGLFDHLKTSAFAFSIPLIC
jgi:hypothetical protein